MLALLLTALTVVLISAYCSLCEAALYALPATYIAQLKEQGHPAAARLEKLRGSIDRPITAILTVNTVANTAGAAVAGGLAASALGEDRVLFFSAALTVAILLFSEILPKTIGVVHSRALSVYLAGPLTLMVWLLTPAIAVISVLTRLLSGDGEQGVSQEEIASLARLGRQSGAIDHEENLVIQNILALPQRPVRSIMTPRTVVFTVPSSATIAEVAAEERIMVHSRVPVYATGIDEIVGMVFRRDVLAAEDTSAAIGTLLRPVDFVGENEPVDVTLDLMLAAKKHMLVVLGDFGGFAGVVTLEDVLEEILGQEIVDEFDEVEDMRELAKARRAAALKRMER